MREYRPYKHQMGVEGPSFWREQQARREQEAAAQAKAKEKQGRDQPKSQEAAPKQQPSMWDFLPHAGEAPRPAPAPAPAPEPAFQRRAYGHIDPRKYFTVAKIWNYVGLVRAEPQYRGESFVVDILTLAVKDLSQAAGEISEFFRIPSASFQGLTLDASWKQVIGPFLESLEDGMNRMKPFIVTGTLRFELDEEQKLVLVYQDR